MKGLSEGIVKLTHGYNTQGICVHKAINNCLVTLFCYSVFNENEGIRDNDAVAIVNDNEIRIRIGRRDFLIILPTNNTKILENISVNENEEIWVTCSNPNTCLLYGNVTTVE